MLVALLALLDIVFRAAWHPHPARLPEQFSAPYLNAYVDGERGREPIVVVGDSALWGYHLDAPSSAAVQLARLHARSHVLNLSYEGGSVVNSLFALRLVLARGVHPAAVVVNLNSKEFNPADSAYKRLQPSLERDVATLLTPRDRALLTTLPAPTIASRLDDAVSSVWALYAKRVDVRVAVFGFDDFAGFVTDRIHALSGENARYAQLHRPTTDAFLGTYNLDPIGGDNVEAIALKQLRDLLVREHIPAVAFLTPTNHVLLADTVRDDGYQLNLRTIAGLARGPGIDVVNLDRFGDPKHFIDNDHFDAAGSAALAARLALELDRIGR